MTTKKTLLLGDIHCNYAAMEDFIQAIMVEYNDSHRFDRIIQVGDFGYYPDFVGEDNIFAYVGGFTRGFRERDLPSLDLADEMIFIRGNHEDHIALSKINDGQEVKDTYLGGWKFAPDGLLRDGILYAGGAWSIDGRARQEARHYAPEHLKFLDQWYEEAEQISIRRMNETLEFAGDHRKDIEILITHDCNFNLLYSLVRAKLHKTRTGVFIDKLLADVIEPEYHFFGHHHKHLGMARHQNGVTKQILLNNIESVRVWHDPNLVDAYCDPSKGLEEDQKFEQINYNGWLYIL